MDGREKFFNYAYGTRTAMSKLRVERQQVDESKMLLMSLSHTPAIVTVGEAGMNASVKGFGFVPKPEYLEEMYRIYYNHLKTYDFTPGADHTEFHRKAYEILYRTKYAPENRDKVDRTRLISIEMAKHYNVEHHRDGEVVAHTYTNTVHKGPVEATLLYYSPSVLTYELRGKVTLHGYYGMKEEEMDLYQKFVNAQHDMNGIPVFDRWVHWPVYVFEIEEVYENSISSEEGWGKRIF